MAPDDEELHPAGKLLPARAQCTQRRTFTPSASRTRQTREGTVDAFPLEPGHQHDGCQAQGKGGDGGMGAVTSQHGHRTGRQTHQQPIAVRRVYMMTREGKTLVLRAYKSLNG
jgi:hypothetical protein